MTLKNMYGFMIGLLFCAQLVATEVRTSIREVGHESSSQKIGSFTLSIDRDEYGNASPDNPIYVRFSLTSGSVWSKSLVDLRDGSDPKHRRSIELAIYPFTGVTLNPNIPDDAVQLVRVIKGERHGWIRITYPSSQWLLVDGSPSAPSPSLKVGISVGVAGTDSVRAGASTTSGGNQNPLTNGLAGTAVFANYRNTPTFNDGDLEILDFIAYDRGTSGVETGDRITVGSVLGIGFSNDPAVARGISNVPCVEFHTQLDDFQAPAHEVSYNRFQLATRARFHTPLPSMYFTNSSDFAWEPGSRLVVVTPEFDPTKFILGGVYSSTYRPEPSETTIIDTEISVTGDGDSVWSVAKIYHNDLFFGFDLTLESGEWPIYGAVRLDDLLIETKRDNSLRLCGYGYYNSRALTGGELVELGPFNIKVAEVEASSLDKPREVIPFTGYDHDEWDFHTYITNPTPRPLTINALFYNRHGILLRVLGQETLPAHGGRVLDLVELYGADVAPALAWIEIIADEEVVAVGRLQDQAGEVLDIFSSVDTFYDTLYGIHVPQADIWETDAYIISSDFETDTTFFIQRPDEQEERLTGAVVPGGTVVVQVDDLNTSNGRAPWFRVNGTSPNGSGLMLYSRADSGTQLASISLNAEPNTTWRYDHVGSLEMGWWNGVAMLNPGNQETRVTVRGFDINGEEATSTSLRLAGQEKLVSVLSQLLPATGVSLSRIQLESDEPILSFLLTGRQDAALLTTVLGNLEAHSQQVLPYLPGADGGWVGLAMVNDEADSLDAVLTPYTADGEAGPSTTITIPAGSKNIFLLSDVMGDFAAYHSIAVSSPQPMRAFALTGNESGNGLATVAFHPLEE